MIGAGVVGAGVATGAGTALGTFATASGACLVTAELFGAAAFAYPGLRYASMLAGVLVSPGATPEGPPAACNPIGLCDAGNLTCQMPAARCSRTRCEPVAQPAKTIAKLANAIDKMLREWV